MFQVQRNVLEGCTVLVVEDEPDSLEVATRILKHYQATVLTAVNGKEALEVLKTQRPSFIISDLSMPEMDGWELLYHLKLSRDTAEIPIIALTAHAMVGDRQRAIEAGFHNYLSKPLTPATFIRDLLSLLLDVPQLMGKFHL
jgi:CheY-like chemotaxis protein